MFCVSAFHRGLQPHPHVTESVSALLPFSGSDWIKNLPLLIRFVYAKQLIFELRKKCFLERFALG